MKQSTKKLPARVELDLPETGVCGLPGPFGAAESKNGCCGGPPKADTSACCVKDEIARADGEEGCGCGAKPKEPSTAG